MRYIYNLWPESSVNEPVEVAAVLVEYKRTTRGEGQYVPDSMDQPITAMPLSRMQNPTSAKPNIEVIMTRGLRTELQSRRPKVNVYPTSNVYEGQYLFEHVCNWQGSKCVYSLLVQRRA
ncbi:hypothetical protein TNCV_2908931 [Trichonephila clavipes]|nr:hypothetical protein TNCV_2908931 [Trichonephila clavipes]